MKKQNPSNRTGGASRKRPYERPKVETFESKDLVKILGAAQALSSSGSGGGGAGDSLLEPVYKGRGGNLSRN